MEETPLLGSKYQELELLSNDGDYRPVREFKEWKSVFLIETVKLWKIAGPIAVTIICEYGAEFLTNAFVGHIGEVELSAVTISTSVIGGFSFGFLLGMGSALETLCGQAFGAGQVEMLGIYMQRSWIVLFIFCIILLPIYIFATPGLKLLGQEDVISELSGEFTIKTIPQLFSFAINFPVQKFLQAQSKVSMLAWIGFVGLIIHVGLLWLFIYVFGWGTTGAAIALDISSWAVALAQVIYVVGWCKDGWKGLSCSAFRELWSFVKLSLASAVMLCLEIWYMMAIIILTGRLENPIIAVGSLSICMNIDGWVTMLFIGVNAAVSVRVSNELGLGRARAAKYSVYVTVFQSLFIGILCMIIVMAARDHIALIFTNSKDLQYAVSRLAVLLGLTLVLNSIQPVLSGVAVGGGWQALVAYINLACYYIFGLPLGFILGHIANMGVMGIWLGMICGIALQTVLLLLAVYKTNWKDEVAQTKERMRKWGG